MDCNNPKLGTYENSNTGKGRPKGALNHATRLGREFAREIVLSPEYREATRMRAIAGTLNPVVEVALLAYAFGKPQERIEIKTDDAASRLADLNDEQLADRAELIAAVLRDSTRLQELRSVLSSAERSSTTTIQ